MSLKRQRGPRCAELPEEVQMLRLHKNCGVAVCEVRRRVKKVYISSGGGEGFTCYFHSEGWDHWRVHACIEARSCRIHYRCWRHQLFIKGGALGRLKKTFLLTSLICFHPPTQIFPLFQEKRLCAHPFLEIYRDGQIHFMVPLARQGDFYVPEVRRVERRPPVKDGLQSDSEVSGITLMLLSTIRSILLTRSTAER